MINPVRSEFVPGSRGKRRHVPATDWVVGKLPKIGASVIDVTASESVVHGQRLGSRITLVRALCVGTLCVLDPAMLSTAIDDGIGSAKGYGCGLLAVGVTP